MAKKKKEAVITTDVVGVDTGLILMIDPCHLFKRSEWVKICERDDTSRAVVEAARKKFKCSTLACFTTAHGDGLYKVLRKDGEFASGLIVEGA